MGVRVERLRPPTRLVRHVGRHWEGSLLVATAGDQGIWGFASSRGGPSVASGWRLTVCKQGLLLHCVDVRTGLRRNPVPESGLQPICLYFLYCVFFPAPERGVIPG